MTDSVRFLGVDFARLHRCPVETVAALATAPGLACVVTPNVDHVVRLDHEDPASPYAVALRRAELKLCDSRVLCLIARGFGLRLDLCTGADLTKDILDHSARTGLMVAVVGPSAGHVECLRRLFPALVVRCIDTHPDLSMEPAAIDGLAACIEAVPWQVLILALGGPKQEIVAACLRERGHAQGVMLCIGAGIDYLTGKQRRAPRVLQLCCLEWLYRGMTERRLRQRYWRGAPRLARLVVRREILPRLGRPSAGAASQARA